MQSLRVMHRDLKPANIFIDSQSNLKLGDLGLGRDFTSQTMEAFSRVGTPLYMPTEMLKFKSYSSKCDVWALGMIYYELLHLKTPWTGKNKENLRENI